MSRDGGTIIEVLLSCSVSLSQRLVEVRKEQIVLGSLSALCFQSKDLNLRTNRLRQRPNTAVQRHRAPARSDNTPFVAVSQQLLDHIAERDIKK